MAVATTALILGGLALAKGANEVISQNDSAKQAISEGKYAADIYGRNADLADQQSKDAIARGRETELAYGRRSRSLESSQRASFAGQGIDTTTGSASDVIKNDQALSHLDQLTIRNNAAREAYGYTQQASIDRAQGDMALRAGYNRAQGLRRSEIGTLLTTATSLYGAYKEGK